VFERAIDSKGVFNTVMDFVQKMNEIPDTKAMDELVYTHLYAKADHDDEMAALGALAATPNPTFGNVIPLHG
jgi:hypothetical protein